MQKLKPADTDAKTKKGNFMDYITIFAMMNSAELVLVLVILYVVFHQDKEDSNK